MSETTKRPDDPESRESFAGLRERVRERMRQMVPMALVAATPLTNTACDPVPQPVNICDQGPSTWARWDMSGAAAWVTVSGERVVQLAVGSLHDPPLQAPTSYLIQGGTFLPPPDHYPTLIRIRPDAGAATVRLTGTAICSDASATIVITIDLVPPDGGKADADPVVSVTAG